MAIGYCACNNGTRENLLPDDFAEIGMQCYTCGQPYTLVRKE